MIATMPTLPGRGIEIKYISFWCDAVEHPKHRKQVRVGFDRLGFGTAAPSTLPRRPRRPPLPHLRTSAAHPAMPFEAPVPRQLVKTRPRKDPSARTFFETSVP